MEIIISEKKLRFALGRILITPNALATLAYAEVLVALRRHRAGDWGDVCSDDGEETERALKDGLRLLSVYRSRGVKFWIITEADRSATTILLPEDY